MSKNKGKSSLHRKFLWLLLILSTPHQIYFCYKWTLKHGFWWGIWQWVASWKLDPVLAFGVVDFLVFMAAAGLWFLEDYKKYAPRKGLLFYSWCAFYLFCPSLASVVYFLFIRRIP
jgi:hypothetical protein